MKMTEIMITGPNISYVMFLSYKYVEEKGRKSLAEENKYSLQPRATLQNALGAVILNLTNAAGPFVPNGQIFIKQTLLVSGCE